MRGVTAEGVAEFRTFAHHRKQKKRENKYQFSGKLNEKE
jgi:hypothetical protein